MAHVVHKKSQRASLAWPDLSHYKITPDGPVIVSPDTFRYVPSGEKMVYDSGLGFKGYQIAQKIFEFLLSHTTGVDILVMVGIPGAGKSTVLRNISGSQLVFDATSCSVKDRKKFVTMAQKAGVNAHAMFINTPFLICMRTNSKRSNDRRVPADVMAKMSKSLVPPTKKEGFESIIVINDLSVVFMQKAARGFLARKKS